MFWEFYHTLKLCSLTSQFRLPTDATQERVSLA